MDLISRFSAEVIVTSTALEEAVLAFESCWVSQCWVSQFGYPEKVRVDFAFCVGQFKEYLGELDINFEPVPKVKRHKIAIESKHRIIRSIYLLVRINSED